MRAEMCERISAMKRMEKSNIYIYTHIKKKNEIKGWTVHFT